MRKTKKRLTLFILVSVVVMTVSFLGGTLAYHFGLNNRLPPAHWVMSYIGLIPHPPPPPQQPVLLGPYVQYTTGRTATIVWETNKNTLVNFVEFGESDNYQYIQYEPSTGTIWKDVWPGLREAAYHHEVEIILPGSFVEGHYRIVSDNIKSGDCQFRLDVDYPRTFSFCVLGDHENDNPSITKAICRQIASEDIDFYLRPGDFVDYGEREEQWQEMLDWQMPLMQKITMFPAIGNHEYNGVDTGVSYYQRFFALPELATDARHNEKWYSFDYQDCHFVILDSNKELECIYGPSRWCDLVPDFGVTSEQYNWLENDLASTNKSFKFVFFHEPIYTSGVGEGLEDWLQLRAAWEPLFHKHNVDMVFNAHNHIYERTEPVWNCQRDENGTVYIVTGGGGGNLCEIGQWDPWTAYAEETYHYCKVTVTPAGEFTFEAKYVDGTVFDKYIIDKKSAK